MTQPNAPRQTQGGPDEGVQTTGDAEQPRVEPTPARPDHAHMVDDSLIGQRVQHAVEPTSTLPPEQASHAGELMTGDLDDAPAPKPPQPPLQDVRVTPDEPSVLESIGQPRD